MDKNIVLTTDEIAGLLPALINISKKINANPAIAADAAVDLQNILNSLMNPCDTISYLNQSSFSSGVGGT